MSRFERTLVSWLLWWAAWVGQIHGQETLAVSPWSAVGDTSYTVITANTLRAWALLYREFSTEFLECLYGWHRGDSVIVRYGVLANVMPRHSLVNGVKPHPEGTCPIIASDSLLGIAHSHPNERAAINGERFHVDPHTNLCYESWPDIASFMESSLELSVVVCGFGRLYILRRGGKPNVGADICDYDPELLEAPPLRCGKSQS